jgi:hypothetical protein
MFALAMAAVPMRWRVQVGAAESNEVDTIDRVRRRKSDVLRGRLFMNFDSTARPKGGGRSPCGRPRAAQVTRACAAQLQRARMEQAECLEGIDDLKEPSGSWQARGV